MSEIKKTFFFNHSSRAHFALKNGLFGKETAYFLMEDEESAQNAFDEFVSVKNIFFKDLKICPIKISEEKSEKAKAIKELFSLPDAQKAIFLAMENANLKIPSFSQIQKNKMILKTGQKINRTEALNFFIKAGFERVSFVEGINQFAIRGSVIDFFSPEEETPVRIFISDKIEEIKTFDIATQQTLNFLSETEIKNISDEETEILNITENNCLFTDEKTPADIITKNFNIIFENGSLGKEEETASADYFKNIQFSYDKNLIEKEINRFKESGYKVFISAHNVKDYAAMEELVHEKKLTQKITLLSSQLYEGFSVKSEKKAVITSYEIFSKFKTSFFKPKGRALKTFKAADLNKGDFLVHEDYGIGKYLGIRHIQNTLIDGSIQNIECLEISYARNDKLLVPVYDLKRVQKFIGSQGKNPKLSHMDTKTWTAVKTRVKKEIEDIAKELLILEAKRAAAKTSPLKHAGEIEKDFEAAFPYEETKDQKKAIFETLEDLQKPVPMNRVIVGDVGFGKTEVAMRAAARAAANSAQTCVLCPTTILAEQHYRNFIKRFEGFPVNIAHISRLTSNAKSKEIIKKLNSAEIDIVIGTHKLLSKNIKFKKLALLIIDEEHKFGVKDKEKLKNLSENLHYLALSATPIPRTLYQSLSELKKMSVIESPPYGRLSVNTKISEYDENAVKNAVENELNRKGQIYYVYNKVESIENKKIKLLNLMPYLKIAVIHGQMPAKKIESAMDDFLDKKYDMLLASTIIESGIDIPSVNTLIIENAHTLGLAQLYQLRGRIGREKQKAYCYMFFPSWLKGDEITQNAVKRLSALAEFSELGSGFRLAMRDLEIRGAGELLGPRQHGFINSIGMEMYIKLLNEQVKRLKGKEEKQEIEETKIDLGLNAYIPQNYIEDEMERLNYYKKLLAADEEKIDLILKELLDISGPPPEELSNLAKIIKLKKNLTAKNIRSVIRKGETLEVYFFKNAKISGQMFLKWQGLSQVKFLKSPHGDGFEANIEGDIFRFIEKLF